MSGDDTLRFKALLKEEYSFKLPFFFLRIVPRACPLRIVVLIRPSTGRVQYKAERLKRETLMSMMSTLREHFNSERGKIDMVWLRMYVIKETKSVFKPKCEFVKSV